MRVLWPCTLVCFVAFGCVATDVGNPQDDPVVSEVRLEAYEETDPRALTFADGLRITHAWIAIDEARFTPCEVEVEDVDDEELEVEGPVVTDLLSGTSFPGPFRPTGTKTVYCGFELEIRPLDASELPAGAPAELAGASMLVRGLRKDNNPWVVRAEFEDALELEGDVELRTDQINRLVVGFAVNSWISQGDLSTLSGNPILIDPLTAPDLHDNFVDAVMESPRLFLDRVGGTLIAE